jgi:hypothetical protein
VLAPGDELQREQHGDDLEDMGGAPGRQRQRRDAEQEDEEDREALLLEELDEVAQRLVPVALQPALELATDAVGLGRGGRRHRGRR